MTFEYKLERSHLRKISRKTLKKAFLRDIREFLRIDSLQNIYLKLLVGQKMEIRVEKDI